MRRTLGYVRSAHAHAADRTRVVHGVCVEYKKAPGRVRSGRANKHLCIALKDTRAG
jgi:hypothetical protein